MLLTTHPHIRAYTIIHSHASTTYSKTIQATDIFSSSSPFRRARALVRFAECCEKGDGFTRLHVTRVFVPLFRTIVFESKNPEKVIVCFATNTAYTHTHTHTHSNGANLNSYGDMKIIYTRTKIQQVVLFGLLFSFLLFSRNIC